MPRWFSNGALALAAVFCLCCGLYGFGAFGSPAPPVSGKTGRPFRNTGQAGLFAVEINQVSAPLLLSLPGLSAETKQDLLRLRSELGAFRSLDELSLVYGIGLATLEKLNTVFVIKPPVIPPKRNAANGRIEEIS